MLPRENRLFGCTRPKRSQGSVPAGLALASDFGFSFQCEVGSSLVLRRPIEITRVIRWDEFYMSPLASQRSMKTGSSLLSSAKACGPEVVSLTGALEPVDEFDSGCALAQRTVASS